MKSFLNQKAPELVVEKWLGDKPNTEGKFIILEFWGVNCNPCKDCIPHLNELNRHFKEDVVIIGLTSDKEEKIATMKLPVREGDKIVRWEKATMDYPIAIDTKKSTREAFGLRFVPYAVIVDPEGIVRWEGAPKILSAELINKMMEKYGNVDKKVEKRIWAKSFLNQKAPEFVVEKWLTDEPDMKDKFLLIDFWGTGCAPCRKAIPDLNEFSKKFKDNLVVIGISGQKEEQVRAMKEPVIEYYSAIDTKKVMSKELEITGIPHVILVDPKGIVRWEGFPLWKEDTLKAETIERIIERYGNKSNSGEKKKIVTENAPTERKDWWAKSVLNRKAPEIIAEVWVPEKPNTKGKFVLLDFWGHSCGPCKLAIPKLNEWHKKFAKDMVVIGHSNDSPAGIKKMIPAIEYTCALDSKHRTRKEIDLRVNSYVLLIDPKGIVRWEGICEDLSTAEIEKIIKEYK